MSELEQKILKVLNKPGYVGMAQNIPTIMKKLCLLSEQEADNDSTYSFIVEQGKTGFILNPATSKTKTIIQLDHRFDSSLRVSDRVLVTINKENGKFEILDIEHICNANEVQAAIKKLIQDGLVYSKNGTEFRSFPVDTGFVQGELQLDDKGNGYVAISDSNRYFINSYDFNGALPGDTIVVKPTNKMYENMIVGKVDKIIRRKDGLLVAKVIDKKKKKTLVVDSIKFHYSIVIDRLSLEEFRDGDKLLVRIDQLGSDGRYHAEFVNMVSEDFTLRSESQSEDAVTEEIEFTSRFKLDRKSILEILINCFKRNSMRKFTLSDISKIVSFRGKVTTYDLEDALKELEESGLIIVDDRGFYRSMEEELGYIQGVIRINKYDDGYVTLENGKRYKIEFKDLHDALDGDTVLVKTTRKIKQGCIIGKVEKIVKRKDGLVVVEVYRDENDEYYLRPFNARLAHPIKINALAMKPLVEGDRIIVKIGELEDDGCYYAGFIKNIGHKDDPDADLKVIAIENNIAIDFSQEALDEADAIPSEVSEEDKEGRLDLTGKLIFSIDGEKTKDRDDAVSIEINEAGNYVVGVHISDVSHYVHPGMKLWDEAMMRGTSVYMVNTVIPMLPHKLSNGICSLNPNEERLAFSCIMEVSPKGEIIKFDFVDTVINSRKAMTYEDVNRIFEEGTMVEGYEEFYDALDMMRKLSARLERNKIRRGYVDFGSNDLEIDVDENGNPLHFRPREQRTAEKIIENLMLLANECYASYMVIPSPLRVHESPDEEKVEEAFELLDKSGIRVKSTHDIVNGKVIQQLLQQIEDMSEREIAANIILRSMKRARYDVEKIGHFGLGLKNYGHWTSPIRRAADLRGHYNLRMQRDNTFQISDYEGFLRDMENLCMHISRKERCADKAEQEANEFEMYRYVASHIGEKFNAHVTYINSKVIFVKTDEGISGRLYPEDVRGDRFSFNDKYLSYTGKKSKRKIKIGTSLVLTALEADRDFGSISFGIAEEDLPYIKSKKRGA